MEFSRISAPSLKELFIQQMESHILSGRLEVGEKLPPERELAENMQVSRAVVNSGINELSRKGFLHVKPRAGVYVADYRRYGTVETLLSIMNYNGGHLNRSEIRSILEIKIVVDRLAAELAVQRLNDDSIESISRRLSELNQAGSAEQTANAAFEFYHELSMISGNTLLPLIYRSFRVPIVHLWVRFVAKYGVDTVYNSARSITESVISGDREAAIKATEDAVRESLYGEREIYED